MTRRSVYELEVSHERLRQYRLIRGRDRRDAELKAEALLARWDDQWKKKCAVESRKAAKAERAERHRAEKWSAQKETERAQAFLKRLADTLKSGIVAASPIDWQRLKPSSAFEKPMPSPPSELEPDPSSEIYRARYGLLGRLIPNIGRIREQHVRSIYEADLVKWKAAMDRCLSAISLWEAEKQAFSANQEKKCQEIDSLRSRYQSAECEAVIQHANLVLAQSEYPELIPRDWDILFVVETGILLVEYQLPDPEKIPRLKQVRYSQATGKSDRAYLKLDQVHKLYDSLVYQICFRAIHELFVADEIQVLKAITFNGHVRYKDRSIGKDEERCIISIQVPREDFDKLDLSEINPAQCFRRLKGVGTPKLHSLSAVPPLMRITKEDERFVESLDIIDRLEEGTNIATISPEEFEHLIGELFRQEFADQGDVRVTRASRDGGIDVVVFDSDEIRGGKIVIQAKRYTNTVGVAAVRELYGVVINEGASKGILVTTSTFGHDAYTFIKDKPITLMDRDRLLYMLQKHRRTVRIDLEEAKRFNRANVVPMRRV